MDFKQGNDEQKKAGIETRAHREIQPLPNQQPLPNRHADLSHESAAI